MGCRERVLGRRRVHAAWPSWSRTRCSPSCCKRIAKQETRHVAFYVSQARERLLKSKRAQKLTRFLLSKVWAPVGSSIMEVDDVKFVFSQIMSGEAGRKAAVQLDQNISKLPGMQGLTIFQKALEGLGVGMGPAGGPTTA